MGKNKIERIKNLIIRFLKYIKGTRRRTKVLYFGILVFVAMFLSIRVGEIMAPVRVTYHVTGGINGIDEKYSVYKEGFNYYLELSVGRSEKTPMKVKISRSEFYRCVNKKLHRNEEIYREFRRRSIGRTDSFNSNIEVEYWWGETEELNENPYADEIRRLYTYKSYMKNREELVDERDRKVLENYRLLNVWSEACYKYQVKDSEIILFNLDEAGKFKESPVYKFIGENSNRTEKEILRDQLEYNKGLIKYDDITGVKNFIRFLYYEHKYLNEKYEYEKKVYKNRISAFLKEANGIYEIRVLNAFKTAIKNNSDYMNPKHDIFKSYEHGNDMINFYFDVSTNEGCLVYYRTNDLITRNLLANEMKTAVKFNSKKEVFGNPYVVVRVALFAFIELGVFTYVGKRRKRKTK